MQNLKASILNADMIVFAIPLYYYGMTAQLKATKALNSKNTTENTFCAKILHFFLHKFVAEDCIQTLFDFGAKNVILYVIAKTRN